MSSKMGMSSAEVDDSGDGKRRLREDMVDEGGECANLGTFSSTGARFGTTGRTADGRVG